MFTSSTIPQVYQVSLQVHQQRCVGRVHPARALPCCHASILRLPLGVGADRIEIALHHPDADTDAILQYELLRYTCATEAFARFFEFKMHVSSHSVVLVPIHLPGEEAVNADSECLVPRESSAAAFSPLTHVRASSFAGDADVDAAYERVTMLQRYFLRPRVTIAIPELAARGITHMDSVRVLDYFSYFNLSKKLPASLRHLTDPFGNPLERPVSMDDFDPADDGDGFAHAGTAVVAGDDGAADADPRAESAADLARVRVVWRDNATGLQDPFYVWPRTRRCVTRMPSILPTRGEVYYMRLLLLASAAFYPNDLKIVNGVAHPDFHSAAVAMGLVPTGREAAAGIRSTIDNGAVPAEVRSLFCLYLLFNTDACDPRGLYDEFWRHMAADLKRPDWRPGVHAINPRDMSDTLCQLLLVRNLNLRLKSMGRTTADFGLPSAETLERELCDAERRILEPEPDAVQQHRALQTPSQAQTEFDTSYAKLTEEQRIIVDYWIAERIAEHVIHIFIDALAGRGKVRSRLELEHTAAN